MKIAVIGTGYVGLVSGTCLAEKGFEVVCVDKDPEKITMLEKGVVPIYEPGLYELVQRNMADGRLHFTTNSAQAIKDAAIVMIAVGTPTRTLDGNADLRFVFQAAKDIAASLSDYAVIVTKSTVPAGTGAEIRRLISDINPHLEFDIASNPEFLREGNAIHDFMEPDRVVIGTNSERAHAIMAELYRPFSDKGVRVIHTDIMSAELIKYAANTFLATKVSFINEMADLCEKLGGNIDDIALGMGSDHRIGMPFLRPGPGYGGSCFPKDTLAMVSIGERALSPATIVESVIAVNRARPHRMTAKIMEAMGRNVRGKRIALLGLTFKPDTDDVRDSVALLIADELARLGADVIAYDPQGMEAAKRILGTSVSYAKYAQAALQHADLAVLATEWKEFTDITPEEYKSLLDTPMMVDLRNAYQPDDMARHGMSYYSVGRKPVIQNANAARLVS